MPHSHATLTEADMWRVCRQVGTAPEFHSMPENRVVVCTRCLELGPDAIEMRELKTMCPECVEEQLGAIDWNRPAGYQVTRQ